MNKLSIKYPNILLKYSNQCSNTQKFNITLTLFKHNLNIVWPILGYHIHMLGFKMIPKRSERGAPLALVSLNYLIACFFCVFFFKIGRGMTWTSSNSFVFKFCVLCCCYLLILNISHKIYTDILLRNFKYVVVK